VIVSLDLIIFSFDHLIFPYSNFLYKTNKNDQQ